MLNSLVSIIIPTYNRGHLITDTLDSILNQSYTNWECLVIDDGSTDDTSLVLKAYCTKDPRFQYHNRPREKLKGGNAARNYGFKLSKGEIINWIDSDDLMSPTHLTLHVKRHFNSDLLLDCVVTNAEVFEVTANNLVRYWSNINVKEDVITEMLNLDVLWPIGCVSWKRNSIRKIPFDENIASSQEWTFHLKQLIHESSYKIIEKTTYLVRNHSDRIGKMVSKRKINSTYLSRITVFDELRLSGKLTNKREHIILQSIITNLQQSIKLNYYSSFKLIASGLMKRFSYFKYKKEILKVLFISVPFYKITGKGYRFFKIKLRQN